MWASTEESVWRFTSPLSFSVQTTRRAWRSEGDFRAGVLSPCHTPSFLASRVTQYIVSEICAVLHNLTLLTFIFYITGSVHWRLWMMSASTWVWREGRWRWVNQTTPQTPWLCNSLLLYIFIEDLSSVTKQCSTYFTAGVWCHKYHQGEERDHH